MMISEGADSCVSSHPSERTEEGDGRGRNDGGESAVMRVNREVRVEPAKRGAERVTARMMIASWWSEREEKEQKESECGREDKKYQITYSWEIGAATEW
jgi:hypothetical protein